MSLKNKNDSGHDFLTHSQERLCVVDYDKNAQKPTADDNPARSKFIASAVITGDVDGMDSLSLVSSNGRRFPYGEFDRGSARYLVKLTERFSWDKTGKGEPSTYIFIVGSMAHAKAIETMPMRVKKGMSKRHHVMPYKDIGMGVVESECGGWEITNPIKERVIINIGRE